MHVSSAIHRARDRSRLFAKRLLLWHPAKQAFSVTFLAYSGHRQPTISRPPAVLWALLQVLGRYQERAVGYIFFPSTQNPPHPRRLATCLSIFQPSPSFLRGWAYNSFILLDCLPGCRSIHLAIPVSFGPFLISVVSAHTCLENHSFHLASYNSNSWRASTLSLRCTSRITLLEKSRPV